MLIFIPVSEWHCCDILDSQLSTCNFLMHHEDDVHSVIIIAALLSSYPAFLQFYFSCCTAPRLLEFKLLSIPQYHVFYVRCYA